MKRKEVMDQLREMNMEELKEQADTLKESLFRLKFKKSFGVGDTINDIRREKKNSCKSLHLDQRTESLKGKRQPNRLRLK